jgi:glycerate kinase
MTPTRRVVLAPDKFKGSLTAAEAAAAMADGVAAAGPGFEARALPVADGGDGSVAAALNAGWTPLGVRTTDAHGAPCRAVVAIREEADAAIIEAAAICGLGSGKPGPDEAAHATTRGIGTVMGRLLDRGIRHIVIAPGGSATTDGGTGLLSALGASFQAADGSPLPDGGGGLPALTRVSLSGLDPRLAETRVSVACDVDTPLLGPLGSAAMFAPQKGAGETTIALLESGLARLAEVTRECTGMRPVDETPGAGAGGGLGWAGRILGGDLRSGAAFFLEMLDARTAITGAWLVVTGEGRLDRQTLRGKAPAAVAGLARTLGVPTVAVVGANTLPAGTRGPFARVVAISELDPAAYEDAALSKRLVSHCVAAHLSRTGGRDTAAVPAFRPESVTRP